MSNGLSENIQFTRGDAERIVVIETKVNNISIHVGRIVKFGYAVGLTVMGSAISVSIKILSN